MSKYQDLNATLAHLFTKTMFEHPEQLEAMPEDDEAFNRWSKALALSAPDDEDRPVVYAVFRFNPSFTPRQASSKRLVTSEVEDLQLQPA